ncbi:hypothetical protein JCM11641_008061 [Rhodosporidiobolus odoratus]
MPSLPYKKPRMATTTVPPALSSRSSSSSARFTLANLPKEVLSRIVAHVAEPEVDEGKDSPSSLSNVSLISRSFRLLALPHILGEVTLDGGQALVKAVRLFKPAGGKNSKKRTIGGETGPFRLVREVSIILPTLYPESPSLTTLTTSLTTCLLLPESLTSLTFSLGCPSAAPTAKQPFLALFPSFPSPLDSLTTLREFRLQTKSEIWLQDLATLLATLSSLKLLEIASLRGDCNTRLDPWAARPRLHTLIIRESSLTTDMIVWLLEGQTALRHGEMPLPGDGVEEGRKAWEAVERVMAAVEVLKVWDSRATTSTRRKRARGGQGRREKRREELKAPGSEEGGMHEAAIVETVGGVGTRAADGDLEEGGIIEDELEVDESPPSPLLPLLARSKKLRTLYLSTSVLPSAPSPESFELVLPHLAQVKELIIEDSPASGLRGAVRGALEGGKLVTLEKVISMGTKRKKGAAGAGESKKGKGDKRLEKACEKSEVEWVVDES